ncbi:BTAD domain-containing putative transcriptional regulator [Amycolatopsis sp. NPDC059657]|uniref:AfsR/SARP family transcriptional regulator n=1 Tax=Amycolatopsis sp. NPDC059657 TaxID=3346899 RepID=UPI00366FA54D
MANFGVLGPLTVQRATGEWVTLRGDRQRSLLAVLLFNANRHVPVGRLVAALWPDLPPKSYVSNLQTYVSRLRERLGDVSIEHAAHGYRLRVGPDELDLLAFRAAAAAGRRTSDPRERAAHLRRALGLWRDHALADLHLPVLDAELARLAAERLAVFGDCVDAELAIGRHTELIGELASTVSEHPLAERTAAQLMVALQRAGRQTEALEVYQGIRTTLVEELGIEPGAELRQAHAAILQGDAGWPLCQLPPDLPDFDGRSAEFAELTTVLGRSSGSVPVVVVSGEPGVGKSALAVRAAHRLREVYPDGQLYVSLSGARDIAEVLADLLRGIGVTGPAIPDDPAARASAFRGRLTGRRVLVVLDDATEPTQVRALIPGTPGCAVLVTSRRRLSGLAGAHRIALGPFSDSEARRLLGRLAGTRVHDEDSAAARIADACGNLPLALRIAGTRLALRPHLRLSALAERLEDEVRRLDELAVSDLQVRGSIALSFEALRPVTRAAFRAIGQVRDRDLPGWTLGILIDDPEAESVVEELVEASLLEPVGVDPTGEPRYRMHDLIRVFAAEHATGHASALSIVHATIALADAAARRLPRTVPMPLPGKEIPPQPLDADVAARLTADPRAWFEASRPNIVRSVKSLCAHGWRTEALALMERLSTHLWPQGYYADMRTGYEALRESALADGDQHVLALADANLALLSHARGHYEQAAAEYRRSAAELARLGDVPALAWTLINLAGCLIGLGDPAGSLVLIGEAAELAIADPHAELVSLRMKSSALTRLGRAAESAVLDSDSVDRARESGEPRQLALALQGFSWSLALSGELGRARELIEESILLLRKVESRSALAKSLRTLGAIHAGLGERRHSVAAYAEARDLARELNERPRELSCARAIAASWIGEGRAAEAIPLLRGCLWEFQEMRSLPSAAITARILAKAYEKTGNAADARIARDDADRLGHPLDANAATLTGLLLKLAD